MSASPPAYYSPVLKTHLKNLDELSLKFQRDLMLLKQGLFTSFEEHGNAFMAAQNANLELYQEEDQRLIAAYMESKNVLLHTYNRDKHLLMDSFYAQVKKDRKERKEAKKYRKAVAHDRLIVNQLSQESLQEYAKEEIALTIIELLGSPPELLANHYERYRFVYEQVDEP